MINGKTFSHKPISELLAIVKNDFRKFDAEGLIDDGTLIKTVQACNDRLGIPIREVREIAIPVNHFKAKLPLDFEKLYYVCALNVTNTMVQHNGDPFNNNFDQDIIYEAALDRESLGNVDNYQVVINRITSTTVHQHGSWIDLGVSGSEKLCHLDCPNKRKTGKYTVTINEDHIDCPFRSGMLYIMYIGTMKDSEGNITFPFHPLITPYYEWTLKEKIIMDAIFNSDGNGLGDMLKLAQMEKSKAWLDAFGVTMEPGYGELAKLQRKNELSWYNKYFKFFN